MKALIKELEPYRPLFIEEPVLAEHDDVIKQSEESETYCCLLRAPAGLFLSFCLLWHYPIFPMLNTDTPEDILPLLGTL